VCQARASRAKFLLDDDNMKLATVASRGNIENIASAYAFGVARMVAHEVSDIRCLASVLQTFGPF